MITFEDLSKVQKKFVLSDNQSLVSASAGTGKTSTMINKIIYLLTEKHIPINRLLIVTYTVAASNEMKYKISEAINYVIKTSNDDLLIDFLQDQLNELNQADIGTIHSICKKIIEKYFYIINIDPTFSIIESFNQEFLLNKSIDKVLKEYNSIDDNSYFNLYESYNLKRNDKVLKEIIKKSFYFLESVVDKEKWFKDALDFGYESDLQKNKAIQYVIDYYKNLIKEYRDIFIYYKTRATSENLERYLPCIVDKIAYINEFINKNDALDLLNFSSNYSFNKKTTIDKKNVFDVAFNEEIDSLIAEFKKAIKTLNKNLLCLNSFYISNNIIKENLLKLIEIVDKVKKCYSKLKLEKNYLDFNDLEFFCLKILENDEIKKQISSCYDYVFVDEYQDVNESQELILSYISKNNLIMIGDVKQSIYAFRNSSPEIFLYKYNLMAKEKVEGLFLLNDNFRSERSILGFANWVFSTLITKNTLGLSYKDDASFTSKKEQLLGNVKLNIINTAKNKNDDSENSDELDLCNIDKECLTCINEIKRFLSTPFVDSFGNKTYFEYKDIAILSRSINDSTSQLYKKLLSYNIPVSIAINDNFLQSYEVNCLINLFKICNNFNNDIDLASLMLSPLCNFSNQDLVDIKASADYKNFFECVLNYSVDDNIKIKINNLLNLLDSIKNHLLFSSIYEITIKIINDYDLLNYFYSLPDGKDKLSNLNEFLKLIENFDNSSDVLNFLDYISDLQNKNIKKTVGDSNSIKILTMHSSKGLEFPCVILFNMGSKLNINYLTNDIIFNNRLGIGLKYLDTQNRLQDESIVKIALKLDNRINEVNEEIRVLYVALTRAKYNLSIIGQYNINKIFINKLKNIYYCTNYLDLILKSLSNNDCQFFKNKQTFTINNNTDSMFDVDIVDSMVDTNDKKEDDIKINGKTNFIITNKLCDFYNYKNKSSNIAVKNTVTNILKETNDFEYNIINPKTLSLADNYFENYDVMQVGTLYHSIMQSIDFSLDLAKICLFIDEKFEQLKNNNLLQYVKKSEIIECYKNIKSLMDINSKIRKETQFILKDKHCNLVENSNQNEDVIVQGVIDLIIENDNNVIIIDYKTNNTNNIETLSLEYKLQLKIYKKAYENAFNKTVDGTYLYLFKFGQLVKID